MHIDKFEMEHIQSLYEYKVDYNLSDNAAFLNNGYPAFLASEESSGVNGEAITVALGGIW